MSQFIIFSLHWIQCRFRFFSSPYQVCQLKAADSKKLLVHSRMSNPMTRRFYTYCIPSVRTEIVSGLIWCASKELPIEDVCGNTVVIGIEMSSARVTSSVDVSFTERKKSGYVLFWVLTATYLYINSYTRFYDLTEHTHAACSLRMKLDSIPCTEMSVCIVTVFRNSFLNLYNSRKNFRTK